jgi:hypothetical protein
MSRLSGTKRQLALLDGGHHKATATSLLHKAATPSDMTEADRDGSNTDVGKERFAHTRWDDRSNRPINPVNYRTAISVNNRAAASEVGREHH